jgi:choline dehydrogenase-like flavoprotein
MADNNYDAIVVGSGISGGWAAKELTEKGLKVLLLERGRDIPHIKGYVNALTETWQFPHRGQRTQKMIEDYPVLKRDYPLNETNLEYWVNDKESPYTGNRSVSTGSAAIMWAAVP